VEAGTAAELVRFGQAIRRLESGRLREVASAEAAIAGPLTDDVAVSRSLNEMINVYLTSHD
jgi:nitric oxide reductase NorQ protein